MVRSNIPPKRWTDWLDKWHKIVVEEGEIHISNLLISSGASPWIWKDYKRYFFDVFEDVHYNKKSDSIYVGQLKGSLLSLSFPEKVKGK